METLRDAAGNAQGPGPAGAPSCQEGPLVGAGQAVVCESHTRCFRSTPPNSSSHQTQQTDLSGNRDLI